MPKSGFSPPSLTLVNILSLKSFFCLPQVVLDIKWLGWWQLGKPLGISPLLSKSELRVEKSKKSFRAQVSSESISITFCSLFCVFVWRCVGRREGLSMTCSQALHSSCILLLPLPHLSVLWARSFIFHMAAFLITAAALRWPMSDLKAIKHKTFCKTPMPPWEIMIITQRRLE